ncbi:PASTA domain-containing protein [Amphibacillus sp. MSJ-3]|uniref:penicillin-binding transpeptidase domain-containing protein n=1 Tax=Amphibacillus sp. MSJ-3 TaxID=2841505 RepID=UPI001C0EC2DD|nr:penicillin-binding transpeptidase domain-containing protein [Amphibacillus sp. MSJ-3]MBU5595393.1 PASTA domain-containing protein [Amphibacillus sp. MSJ-3]
MKNNKKGKWKINLLFGVFASFFFILSGRLIFIQVSGEVQGVDLQEWANRQRTNYSEIPARRGYVYDRNGMKLAQDITTYRLYAIVDESFSPNPQMRLNHVADLETTAEKLAPIINMEQNEVYSILNSGIEKGQFQVEFGKNGNQLTREQKNEIEELELPGVHFIEEAQRYYPNGLFASQLIGLAQSNDDHVITGITGIEAQLDDLLRGEKGSISFQRDKFNTKLMNSDEVIVEAKDGLDVVLTLDQKIQTILEDAMTQVEEKYQPERITATVADPKTGEILAMSSRPSYNPNDLEDVENWYNDVVSTPIEPGSTVKAFTLAAAIEEGVYNPKETYKSGSYSIDQIDRPITDYNKSWGNITYEEGFQRSSNVAMSKLVWEKLGTDRYLDYLKAFHFDQPTEIDLPREQAGTLLYRYPVEQLTTSFGQGSTMTPIQIVKAATALANDGKMMKPYVIKKVFDSNTGEVIEEKEPEVVGEPISKETADQVLQAMESVVTSDVGTAKNIYNLDSYTVAGKTGTAQISGGTSGYLEGHENYIFSFLGMAPSDDPELIMYITVKQPKLSDNESGSAPVSFIFKHVMENGLHYLNIQPDKEQKETVHQMEMPDWENDSKETVISQLADNDFDPILIGDGEQIVAANMDPGTTVLSTQKLILVTDQPRMPDLSGWSIRSVTEFAHLIGLDLEVIGSGYVTNQSIEPNELIEEGQYLLTEFSTE